MSLEDDLLDLQEALAQKAAEERQYEIIESQDYRIILPR